MTVTWQEGQFHRQGTVIAESGDRYTVVFKDPFGDDDTIQIEKSRCNVHLATRQYASVGQHGGARIGAGRPKGVRVVQCPWGIPSEYFDQIHKKAKSLGIAPAEAFRQILSECLNKF